MQNGPFRVYGPGRTLKQEIHYAAGQRSGDTVEYFATGKVKARIPFRDDQEHGMATFFHGNGKELCRVTYDAGKRHGNMSCRYRTGEPLLEETWERGNLVRGRYWTIEGKLVHQSDSLEEGMVGIP